MTTAAAPASTSLGSVLASDISALTSKGSSVGASVISGVLSLFSTSLVTLAEDELVILGDAISSLKAKRAAIDPDTKQPFTWEQALTAAYNTFYNEEQTEAVKIATGILAAVGKVLSVAEGLFGIA